MFLTTKNAGLNCFNIGYNTYICVLLGGVIMFGTWLAIFIIGILIYCALVISYENRIKNELED